MGRILAGQRLTEQKWLNLFEIDFLDHAGRGRKWQLATREAEPKCLSGAFSKPDAVVVVPYHTERRQIVITREYRVALAGFEYGFPAGLVDPGESAADAAARELKEETGLSAVDVVYVGPPVFSSAGLTDESVSMVCVACRGEPSTAGNEGSEQIEVLLVDPAGARGLCSAPDIRFDAKAWLVLTVYGRTGEPWSFFKPLETGAPAS